jgi:hypothetical protein
MTAKAKAFLVYLDVPSQNGTAAAKRRRNFRVFNILPVTTLRTIDLGGKKIPEPLLSRFCGE